MSQYLELLNGVKAKKLSCNYAVLCELEQEIVTFLSTYNVTPFTKEIYITHKGLSHLMRDSKKKRGAGICQEDLERLPQLVCHADVVIFNSQSSKLNLLYITNTHTRYIKIVINPNGYDKKLGKLTLLQTAGTVQRENLTDKKYKVIKGEL